MSICKKHIPATDWTDFNEKPPWTPDQWEDFAMLVETLEVNPQLWAGLRSFARESLHPRLFQALEREGYERRTARPVPDLPRDGRIKCRECDRVDCCPVPERQKRQGLETLHYCEECNMNEQAKDGRSIVTEPLEIHPIGEIFPWMTAEEMEGLKDSIKKHGLIEPIILFQGRILDGKCRYKACREVGATIWARTWEGGMDPVEYVVSKNLHRAQLTPEQLTSSTDAARDYRGGQGTSIL